MKNVQSEDKALGQGPHTRSVSPWEEPYPIKVKSAQGYQQRSYFKLECINNVYKISLLLLVWWSKKLAPIKRVNNVPQALDVLE